MATKAQLEAELAELRIQLARKDPASDGTLNCATDETDPVDANDAAASEVEADIVDWEEQIQDVLKDLEDLPHKKPLLFALGAFALGYLIGRSR